MVALVKMNLWPLAVIDYSDNLAEGIGGTTQLFYIRILKSYIADRGIHEHELVHAGQFWMTFGLHALVKEFSKRYRIWSEAKAYLVQTKYPDRDGHNMTVSEAAARLAGPHYNLGLTQEQAEHAIRNA